MSYYGGNYNGGDFSSELTPYGIAKNSSIALLGIYLLVILFKNGITRQSLEVVGGPFLLMAVLFSGKLNDNAGFLMVILLYAIWMVLISCFL